MESTTQSPKPFRNYAGLIAAGVDNVVGLTGTRSFQTTCSLYQKKFLAATFCAGEATSPKMEFTPTPTLFQLQDEPSIYGHFQWGKWRQVTINPWIWRYGIPLLFTLKQHFWLFIPKKNIENVLNLYAIPVNLILAGEIPPRKIRKKHA